MTHLFSRTFASNSIDRGVFLTTLYSVMQPDSIHFTLMEDYYLFLNSKSAHTSKTRELLFLSQAHVVLVLSWRSAYFVQLSSWILWKTFRCNSLEYIRVITHLYRVIPRGLTEVATLFHTDSGLCCDKQATGRQGLPQTHQCIGKPCKILPCALLVCVWKKRWDLQ